ncbi:AI-2E family transporter [Variovorax boronicumulans]|uniref:AI-2E family transporter n=1 Tax=Variovorax boronicumulans TaxID=436515 RepID=UPI003395CF3C
MAKPLPTAPVTVRPQPASRNVVLASYLLMPAALMLVMWQHLLPGLLCVCIGFLATRWFARLLERLLSRPRFLRGRARGLAGVLAFTLVLVGPIALLTIGLSQAREYIIDAPDQYRELLDYTARTVLELRLKLPHDIAVFLPEGAAEVQRVVANYLRAQAGSLAMAGRAWLGALLFAYVGLIVGGLAAIAPAPVQRRPLADQLHRRVTIFGEAFGQIVAAQFWIAAFNTLLTAIFLLFLMPLWGLELPYTPALITLTFVAGLVPIVGNLVCNSVITLVALSVSPVTALACLMFLILIHKAEYVINAKVVGSRTKMSVWELLAVMFVAEAVFGPAGLVAAPLFYAYLKKELQAAALV